MFLKPPLPTLLPFLIPLIPPSRLTLLVADFEEVCKSKLAGRWEDIKIKFESRQWTGADINKVIEMLEAPHLKPTGMLERLQDGVEAAAFGVATLVNNLE